MQSSAIVELSIFLILNSGTEKGQSFAVYNIHKVSQALLLLVETELYISILKWNILTKITNFNEKTTANTSLEIWNTIH